jgi:hypothetical protein
VVDAAVYFLETINIGKDKWSSRVSDSLEVPAVNKKEYAGVQAPRICNAQYRLTRLKV